MENLMIDKYGPVVRDAFAAVGLPVEWGMAIAHMETGGSFDPSLVKMTGGDGARGGAWGLCQMTLKTAEGLGYDGDGPGLLEPKLNSNLAAKLCVQLQKSLGSNLHDVAAAYNSGKAWSKAPERAQAYAGCVVSLAQDYGKVYGYENVAQVESKTEPKGSEKSK